MNEDECLHGMVLAYCAQCRGLLSPEEQEKQMDAMFLVNLMNWNR